MRKIVNTSITVKRTEDILCDMCGASCIGKCCRNPTNAVLEVHGNYENQDQTHLKCDLCPKCFEEVVAFIISKGGHIRKCHWSIGEDNCEFCHEEDINGVVDLLDKEDKPIFIPTFWIDNKGVENNKSYSMDDYPEPGISCEDY